VVDLKGAWKLAWHEERRLLYTFEAQKVRESRGLVITRTKHAVLESPPLDMIPPGRRHVGEVLVHVLGPTAHRPEGTQTSKTRRRGEGTRCLLQIRLPSMADR
jgi:hypothetical protein